VASLRERFEREFCPNELSTLMRLLSLACGDARSTRTRCSTGKRLTSEEAQCIREEHQAGASFAELATRFGCSTQSVWKVITGRTHRSVREAA
jgi:hypothetical protein